MKKRITFADIFSGCGGLSYGFAINPNFEGLIGIDHSPAAGKVFEQNHNGVPFQLRDLFDGDQVKEVIKLLKGTCDVLLGGPPCQGFSTLGKRRDADKRSTLVDVFLNLISEISPKVVILENVRGIKSMKHPSGATYPEYMHDFLKYKSADAYDTTEFIIDTLEYGLAQTRVRYVLLAVKKSINKNNKILEQIKETIYSKKTNDYKNLIDVIGDLPEIESGQGSEIIEICNPDGKTKIIHNHKAMKHSARLVERLMHVPVGGGLPDVPKELLTPHLQKMVDGGYGSGGHVKNIYGRLDWNKPSGTIVAGIDKITCGRFVHPKSNRLLTPRECARLQSFPDDFIFSGGSVAQYYMIGNAVPPKISQVFASAIEAALSTQ